MKLPISSATSSVWRCLFGNGTSGAANLNLNSKTKWLIRLVLFASALCFVLSWISCPQEPVASVTILPFQIQLSKTMSPWREKVTAWSFDLKRVLFGPPSTIALNSALFEFDEGMAVGQLSLPEPAGSDTNGLQVWLLDREAATALRLRLTEPAGARLVARAVVITSHGIQGAMSIGESVAADGTNRDVGLLWACLPRLRGDSMNLLSVLTLTALQTNRVESAGEAPGTGSISIQTNLAVAARFQVPRDHSVFLLQRGRSPLHGKTLGFIVSAVAQAPPKSGRALVPAGE